MKKRLFFVWLGIISFQLHAQDEEAGIRKAMAIYDYETALLLIEEVEEQTPALWFQKARALRGLNRYKEALQAFQSILDVDPESQQALLEQAECYKSAGKQQEALINYKTTIELYPENKYAWLQLVTLLCQMERYAPALEYAEQLLEKDDSNVTLRLLAQCHEGLKQTEAARKCYEKIIERSPDDYLAVARLANIHIGHKDIDKAIECTEAYRRSDTLNIHVNRQNALSYCISKDYKTASQRYKVLLDQQDSTFHTCYYGGISFFGDGQFYEAHDILKKALDHSLNNVNVLYYLAKACSKTSWKQEAVTYMQEAIRLSTPADSTLIWLYSSLAECYQKAFRFPEYIETLKLQYTYDSSNHRLLYHIATSYHISLKDEKNAILYLEKFPKTRDLPGNKPEPVPDPDTGGVTLTIENFYNAAENRLKDIRKEQFFREGIPEKSSE
ncbi:MAG: tetratricopeptide repeat protein [Bacteroides sp.]|nr:tetratricopeptide repeat protein [Bacteroides sp.]